MRRKRYQIILDKKSKITAFTKYRKLIFFVAVLLTVHQFVLDAYAYVDPVTGSAFLTMLVGALAAGAMGLK